MNEIQVTVSTILALFGALAVVAGGVKVIMQMCSPFKRIAQRITECEKRLDNHDIFLGNDKQAIADMNGKGKYAGESGAFKSLYRRKRR